MNEEDLPTLCFGQEPLLPDRDSYQLGVAYGAINSDIGGGPVRSRANFRNNSVNVTATYTLDPCQTQGFMDWYYAETLEGQLPVRVRLDLTGSDLVDETWYVATILSISAPTYTGVYSRISVTYNAVPQIDKCVSQSRSVVYQAFGSDTGWIIANIDRVLSGLARLIP